MRTEGAVFTAPFLLAITSMGGVRTTVLAHWATGVFTSLHSKVVLIINYQPKSTTMLQPFLNLTCGHYCFCKSVNLKSITI